MSLLPLVLPYQDMRISKLVLRKKKRCFNKVWVQISLRPTLYSYFKESFSGEYHIYIHSSTTLEGLFEIFCLCLFVRIFFREQFNQENVRR